MRLFYQIGLTARGLSGPKLRWEIVFLLSVILVCPDLVFGQNNRPVLVSGLPVKAGTKDRVGRFSLESIAALNMGTAKVDDNDSEDLFLMSDSWHPGTYLYFFKGFTKKNEPIFSQPVKIKMPFVDDGKKRMKIIQLPDGTINGYWRGKGGILCAQFDRESNAFFYVRTITVSGLPDWEAWGHFGVTLREDGSLAFLFTVREKGASNGIIRGKGSLPFTREGFWPWKIPDVGIYGGLLASVEADTLATAPLTGPEETFYAFESYSLYSTGNRQYIIAGTYMGNFYAYPVDVQDRKLILGEKRFVIDNRGILHRNPAIHGCAAYFSTDKKSGLIVSSEGGIFYYANRHREDARGNLVFSDPVHVMQEQADLYGGSLVVPELADWNGDGTLDIISGTSTGEIWFFENRGTNELPAFQNPVPLAAGGSIIKVQPGYKEDIQGPGEARWGYTAPTVFDWDQDGLPDILTGDSRGKFMVYLNRGSRKRPVLEKEAPLYIKGLDMFGAWRVKPGVANVNGKIMYVCLDSDDELHLYWKIDNYNLQDGGKLKLTTNRNIQANYQDGGAVGRARIEVVDWDNDGRLDLIIGLPKWGSMPDKKKGIPFFTKEKAATVVFLKNMGTNLNPQYQYPSVLKFKGKTIMLGGHECGPTVGRLGSGTQDNLVVGNEKGQYIYYNRQDLSW